MDMSTMTFGKSESQARKGEEGKFKCKIETIFTCKLWVARREWSVGKSTNHGMLERNHCFVVFYVDK
jgi:hypothetical protein